MHDNVEDDVARQDALTVGDVVEVHGLQGAKHLNGRWGRVVVAPEDADARYGVKVDGVEDPKSLRPSNLHRVVLRATTAPPGMPSAFIPTALGTPVSRLLLRHLQPDALFSLACCQSRLRDEVAHLDEAWSQLLVARFGGTLAGAKRRVRLPTEDLDSPYLLFRELAKLSKLMESVRVEHGELPDALGMGVDAIVVPTSPAYAPYGTPAQTLCAKAGPELAEHLKELEPLAVGEACWTPSFGCGIRGLVHVAVPSAELCNGDRLMRAAHTSALEVAAQNGCTSLALCALPLAERGVQLKLTACFAAEEIRNALAAHPGLRVTVVALHPDVKQTFEGVLTLMKERTNEDLLEELPVVVLDSMVPRQRLTFDVRRAPVALDPDCDRFAMVGVMPGPRGQQRVPAGVEVRVTKRTPGPGGALELEVVAGRQFLVPGILQRWSAEPDSEGRFAFVASLMFLPDKEQKAKSKADLAKSALLGPLVETWLNLVREGGRERQPGQMDMVLGDIGPMPRVELARDRAMWVCALINPLPGLGVAWEIRPRALLADTDAALLDIALGGIRASIAHLDGSSPMR